MALKCKDLCSRSRPYSPMDGVSLELLRYCLGAQESVDNLRLYIWLSIYNVLHVHFDTDGCQSSENDINCLSIYIAVFYRFVTKLSQYVDSCRLPLLSLNCLSI